MTISIELFRPSFGEEESEAVKETIESKWWGLGPKTRRFEERFADYIGVDYALGVNSGTSALILACQALSGSHIRSFIVPSITFIASYFAPIYQTLGDIYLADVDPETMLMTDETIQKTIDKFKINRPIVIPVHLYGNMFKFETDNVELASKVKVIEDCAHACGSSVDGKKAGSLGTIGCFSFHAVKNLACGDGGMVTTNDKDLYERMKSLRWFGITKSTFERSGEDNLKTNYGWEYDVIERGHKMHMNDLTAAIGLVQLKKLDGHNQSRRMIARRYLEALGGLGWIDFIGTNPGVNTSQHIFAIKTRNRNELNVYLKEQGIATGVHYKPIYEYSFIPETMRKTFKEHCPNTESEWPKLLSLPCYPSLTELEQEYVISRIKEFGRVKI